MCFASGNVMSWSRFKSSLKDMEELINSMCVLAMHTGLVNLSRQIQVWDLMEKTQQFLTRRQFLPPHFRFSHHGAQAATAASCTLSSCREHQDPCYLRGCSWLPPRQKGPSVGYRPPTGSLIWQLAYLLKNERLNWRLLEKNQWGESSKV